MVGRSVLFLCVVLALSSSNASLLPSNFQRGMSFYSGGWPLIDSAQSLESLKNMMSLGTTHMALIQTWYQDNINSTVVAPIYPQSMTDEGLANFLGNATAMGLQITFKPHVDSKDGKWRAYIGSTFTTDEQWDEWFVSYNAYILKCAVIAQKYKLPQMTVGTEMISASNREAQFRDLISQVRQIYGGKVTYAANWSGFSTHTQSEVDSIAFWDALDFIGIDAYYHLTTNKDPTENDLLTGWAPIVPYMANVSSFHNRSILFTEIGYVSVEGAAIYPGNWNVTGAVNATQQALCYNAVFNVFSTQSWWEGVYWWNWFANPYKGGLTDISYTPWEKPAQDIITQFYTS